MKISQLRCLLLCASTTLLFPAATRAQAIPLDTRRSAALKDVVIPGALESSSAGWIDLLATVPLAEWIRAPLPPNKPLSGRNPWRHDPTTGMLVCEATGIHEMLLFPQEQRDGILHGEWRYIGAVPKPSSGIFFRTQPDNTVSYQAQLAPASSGVLFGASRGEDDKPRRIMAGFKRPDLVRPTGVWNVMEVTCRGLRASLWYNGVVVAETEDLAVPAGFVGLEAEGAPIEFRRIIFKPFSP